MIKNQMGDENTRLFHGYVNNKQRKNRIHGLNINVEDIKKEVFWFYKEKFHEQWPTLPKLLNHKFCPLDQVQRESLETLITLVAIKTCNTDIWL
uniref:Uncharacterized protein n=1 Tax=Lactuca sativa TaxID=4236 RepID=A0A9R1WZG1_LACSA|nr:hypothetical protein LSAT_V11C800437420 [Lactuca sativa]